MRKLSNAGIYLLVILYITIPFIAATVLHQYNIYLSTNLAMVLVVGWYSIAVVVALLPNIKK